MRGSCKFVTMGFDGMTTKNMDEEIVEKIPASIAGLSDDAVILGVNLVRGKKTPPPEVPGPKGKVFREEPPPEEE